MRTDETLRELGIPFEAIVDTAMSLWVPHPGVETEADARKVFSRELSHALEDPNLWILIHAGIALERDASRGLVPYLDASTYEKDLTRLIADEVLGIAVSMYVGGYKGHFDYVRFDKIKPGIIGSLGPFMDDIVAGLIGGISANMYDRGRDASSSGP